MRYLCTSKNKYILEMVISVFVLLLLLLCFFPSIEFTKNSWSNEAMDYITTTKTQDGDPMWVVVFGCIILIGVWIKRLIFSWMGMVASVITIGKALELYLIVLMDEVNGQIYHIQEGNYNDIGTPAITWNGYAVIFVSLVIFVLYIIYLYHVLAMRRNANKQRSEEE